MPGGNRDPTALFEFLSSPDPSRRDLRRPYKPLEGDSRARPADNHRPIPAADCEEGALSDLLAASTHQVAAGQDKGKGRLAAEGDPFGGGVGVR